VKKKGSKWGGQKKQAMYSCKINKWIKSVLCPGARTGHIYTRMYKFT